MQSYPAAALPFLAGQDDPFRNPVGHTLRQSLTTLFEELIGDMNASAVATALDAIIRIRAVQDLTASQAVGFLFLLKPLTRKLAPEQDHEKLADRIDRLALMAFDKYMQCREQVAQIRLSESRRNIRGRQAATEVGIL